MGRPLDLVAAGARIVSHTGKNIAALLPRYCRANSMLRVYRIDNYDDLLYPGHRLLAQLPVFASGDHFEKKISAAKITIGALYEL